MSVHTAPATTRHLMYTFMAYDTTDATRQNKTNGVGQQFQSIKNNLI